MPDSRRCIGSEHGSFIIGNFHYTPAIFVLGDSLHDEHKLMLTVEAILLSRLQETKPDAGLCVLGSSFG